MVTLLSTQLKPFRKLVFLIVFFVFVQALAELALPTLLSNVVNDGMLKGDLPYIFRYGGYMLAVALASSALSVLCAYLSSQVALGLGQKLRSQIFRRVSSFSLSEIDQFGTASLITRTTNDIIQIQTVLVMMLRFVIFSPAMCVGGLILAFSKDRSLTLILAVIIPILVGFMVITSKRVIPIFRSMQKKLDHLNLVLRENLTGIRVIRAFNKLTLERDRFAVANEDLTDTAIRANKAMVIMQPFMMLLMNVTTIAIVWFGGLRIAEGNLSIGDMMAFLQYAMHILFSFIMVAFLFMMLPRAQASADRIMEVFNQNPEIKDAEFPITAPILKGTITFEHASFRYAKAEEPALNNISFTAIPGEVTAIIGGTGAGKSTILNLITRFYDVTEGTVKIDGIDIRDYEQATLRAAIGYVPQSAVLFSGTIAENLRYGSEAASEQLLVHAANTAQASEFINEMTDGYQTTIAQGGTNLSGGQKQRLSIARALIRKPLIYLFDDSFSALDFKTDANLRAALKQETKQATVLIVAQRVSTVMDADRILVLDEGRLVGNGTHSSLLLNCSVYQEIVASQLSDEEVKQYA